MGSHHSTALAVALLLLAPPVAAQRAGVWVSLGLGTGMHEVACDICRAEDNGGWSARAAVGGTLSRRLKLGAEIHGWTDRTDDIRFTFYSVTPALYWYPSRRGIPYFLMGGAGYAAYRASDDTEVISSSGIGATFGAGLELPLAGRFKLTPFATYTGSFLAHLKYDRTDIARAQLSLFQLGLGITRR